jgi:hypothetical protein
MEFLTAPGNWPFSAALTIVLLLGLLEALGLLLGTTSFIGADSPDVGVDVSGDAVAVDGPDAPDAHGGIAGNFLEWLHFGELPTTILLLLFLLGFGIAGLTLQWLIVSRFGATMPASIASVPAGVVALMSTRIAGGLLKPVLPRDESEAVSRDSFVGCGGQITIGTARPGKPAEARVKDRFGHTHYLMVEPDGNDEFPAGSHVLLLKRRGDIYRVIDNTGAQVDDLV